MTSLRRQRKAMYAGLLISLCLTASLTWAQNPEQDSCSRPPCTPVAADDSQPVATDAVVQAANQDPDAAQNAPSQTGFLNTHYAPALNGAGPIDVQQPRHLHLLYALSTSQGYTTDIAGPFSNISSYTSVYEGYGGLLWRMNHGYVVLQQDSAVTYFGSSLLEGSSFHQTALLSSYDLAPSLNLTFQAQSSIGNNTLTQLIPPTEVIVNGVPVTSPGAATTGLNLGFVWGSDVVGILSWKPDNRDIFSFRAENANHQFYGLDLHDNQETFKLMYQRAISENTLVGAYGMTRHEVGTQFCDNYGFGLMAATKPTSRLYLTAEAGPEFDSTGCFRHQGFELHFTGTYRTSPTSYLYAIVDRQMSSGFVPSSTWQDDAGAGFAKQLTRRLWWSIGGGYERGFVLPSITPYHGLYAQTELRQRLTNSLALEGLYRRLDQSITGLGVHSNVFLVTLRWSPRNHDPGRTAMYQTSSDYRSGHEE